VNRERTSFGSPSGRPAGSLQGSRRAAGRSGPLVGEAEDRSRSSSSAWGRHRNPLARAGGDRRDTLWLAAKRT